MSLLQLTHWPICSTLLGPSLSFRHRRRRQCRLREQYGGPAGAPTYQLVRASRTSRFPDASSLIYTVFVHPNVLILHERLTLILCESAAVVRLATATQSSVTSPAGGQQQGSE